MQVHVIDQARAIKPEWAGITPNIRLAELGCGHIDNGLLPWSGGTRDRGYNHDPGERSDKWNDQAKSGSFHHPLSPTMTTAGSVRVDAGSPGVTASSGLAAPIVGLPPDHAIACVHGTGAHDQHERVSAGRQMATCAQRTGRLRAMKDSAEATEGATTTPGGGAALSIDSCTSVRRLTISPLSHGPLTTAGETTSNWFSDSNPPLSRCSRLWLRRFLSGVRARQGDSGLARVGDRSWSCTRVKEPHV